MIHPTDPQPSQMTERSTDLGMNQEGSTASSRARTVWAVMESIDYDSQDVVAIYSNEELANTDVQEMGGWVRECEILDTLRLEVTDPTKVQERQDERDKSRKAYEAREAHDKQQQELRANVKPHDRMGLCHCAVWSPSYDWINAHGYCTFCGGFVISVFRQHLGEDALQAAIDKLAIHDRERMREIATATP